MLLALMTPALAAPAPPARTVSTDARTEVRLVQDLRWDLLVVELADASGHHRWSGTTTELAELELWIAQPHPPPVRLTVCGRADAELAGALAARLVLLEPPETPTPLASPPTAAPPANPPGVWAQAQLDDVALHCRAAAAAPAEALADLSTWLESP